MNKFLHSFYTWLLTNLFFPFSLVLTYKLREDAGIGPGAGYAGIFFITIIISMVCTIPSFIGIYLWLSFLTKQLFKPVEKLILWSFGCFASAGINCVLVFALAGGHISNEIIYFILPAVLSVFLSICIRMPFLLSHFSSQYKTQDHEINMV